MVASATPIVGASVQLWVVTDRGQALSSDPIAATTTGLGGEFHLDVDLEEHREFIAPPFLLLNAFLDSDGLDPGGQDSPQENKSFHLWVLIPGDDLIGPYTNIMVSPLTTVAKDLGDARFEQGKEATYAEAAERAHQLIGAHFWIPDIIRYERSDSASPFTAGRHHDLVLRAMSALAREMYQDASDVRQEFEIFALTEALLADAAGPGAVFDGLDSFGLPVARASCSPACELGPDTLRTDLVRALARDLVGSPEGAGDTFGDAASLLLAIATNTEPELFGGAVPEPVDDRAPELVALASPVLDERLDIISFDEDTLAPRHIHGTESVDLAQGFAGQSCPEVYKHVNLMNSSEDNPLRLRFLLGDDIVGIDDESVSAVVRVDSTGEEFPVPAHVVRAPRAGWREYEVVLVRDQVPALAAREGMFQLTVQAGDWLGNEMQAVTCWIHTPLAPPLWVSEPRVADQADSLAAVTLSGDNNDLAALLNGAPLDLGKSIMEFEIANGTSESAYVTLTYSQPSAVYSKSWTDTYAALYDFTNTSCIQDMTCAVDPTLNIRNFHSIRGTIAELITGIRVWDVTDTAGVEISTCNGCDAGEYHIAPRLENGAPRRYRVALVTTHLRELAPVDSDEPPMAFVDLPLHPVYLPMFITGYIGQTLSVCAQLNLPRCGREVILQSYRALTEVSIVTDTLEALGQLSAAPDLSLHVPRPNAHTFGKPVRVSELQWFTLEDPLPPIL